MDWQKLLLAAGGAAGVAAVLYYLLRDDPDADQRMLLEEEKQKKSSDLAKADVLEILEEISSMQQVMKTNMKAITKEMAEKEHSFEEVYNRVKEAQPADPLEKRGLSHEDLDKVLQNSSTDPEVMQAVAKIMGPPEAQEGEVVLTKRAKEITVEMIVDIHVFMLEELRKFVQTFEEIPNKSTYDMKTVGSVSQAILDSKVSAKYKVASEDMEGAILTHRAKLVKDMKFMQTHMEMQQVMQQFLGVPM